MSEDKPATIDFDDAMRRAMSLPADRAKQIIKKTAPAKSAAERAGAKPKKTKKRR